VEKKEKRRNKKSKKDKIRKGEGEAEGQRMWMRNEARSGKTEKKGWREGTETSVATYRIGKPIEPFILLPLLFPSLESTGSLPSICTHRTSSTPDTGS